MLERYSRQLSLPDITPAQQNALSSTHIIMVGAGGLGAAALPYLAGAGIGHITIIDHDTVHRSNLHRQTHYQDPQLGQNKATLTAAYLSALNPDISINAIADKLTVQNAERFLKDADLILDGSDNFETKTLLNQVSITLKTPLITASVNQFKAIVAILGGHITDAPCYACLFPELPKDALNCNEAGILGTSAGLAGLYQAHLTLLYLLNIAKTDLGTVLTCDFKTMRNTTLILNKDSACTSCNTAYTERHEIMNDTPTIPLIAPRDLKDDNTLVIDVRTLGEIESDPIEGALHMEVTTVPQHYSELPHDKRLAFACASNIRSAQAAAFVQGMGYKNVCIYDKLAE